jgi:hypothetical protein
MNNPVNLPEHEYIIHCWRRGLLSDTEAMRALSDHCTALLQQRDQLRAALQAVGSSICYAIGLVGETAAERAPLRLR